jgi:hypothetical protein
MGMGQLGKEISGVPKPGVGERELQRRLWWSLVTLDWQYAAHLNNTYCIHPNQFDTALPANLDLDELKEEEAFVEKPDSQHTSASLLRAKCEIAQRTRKLEGSLPPGCLRLTDGLSSHSALENLRMVTLISSLLSSMIKISQISSPSCRLSSSRATKPWRSGHHKSW